MNIALSFCTEVLGCLEKNSSSHRDSNVHAPGPWLQDLVQCDLADDSESSIFKAYDRCVVIIRVFV